MTVSKIISPNDQMLGQDGLDQYLSIGERALEICRTALGSRTPSRILDYPIGHGRVARWFRHQWPKAEIYGVEVDDDALEFTSKTFGTQSIFASRNVGDTKLPSGVDLIFCGSLLTHFDEWQWDAFFESCTTALADDGIFVATVHGRVAALLAEDRHPMYGSLIDTKALYHTYCERGFAYLPYSKDYPSYGLSLSSPAWIMKKIQAIPRLKIMGFEEQGWGQDVLILKKNPWDLVKTGA